MQDPGMHTEYGTLGLPVPTIYGTPGNDTITPGFVSEGVSARPASSSRDSIAAGDGNDSVRGDFPDTLDGGPGADTLGGGFGGPTTKLGGEGDDYIFLTSPLDRIDGGPGNDTLDLSFATGNPVVFLSPVFWVSDSDRITGIEAVFGSRSDDKVSGDAGPNLLIGLSGADSLRGDLGDDTIDGGPGDDTLRGNAGNNWLDGGGEDDLILGGPDRDTQFGGSGADTLFGTDGDDALYGGTEHDNLSGGDGNDLLDGGSGADTLDGGAGADVFVVDDARDVVLDAPDAPGHVLASVSWRMAGHIASLTLVGPLARDGVGNGAGNRILGNDFANVLWGRGGADTLDGGRGADLLRGGEGDDRLVGGGGKDSLHGDAGADTLEGGGSLDMLSGGAGDDLLIGGGGADALLGGSGADRFVLHVIADPLHADRIRDFDRMAGDRITLLGTGLAAGALDPAAFAANTSGLATTAAHRVIYETDAGRLWFDADGNDATIARVLVASLTGAPSVSAADILPG